MKKLLLLIVVIAVAAAALLYRQPWMVAGQLDEALRAGDEAALGELVDFPRVKESLTEQVKTLVQGQTADPQPEGFLANLGRGFLETMVGGLVEAMVGPRSIGAFVGVERDVETPAFANATLGWEGLEHFHIEMPPADADADDPVPGPVLVLERQGIAWKLVEVRVPIDRIAERLPQPRQ